jgi:SP family general alpha glucoside:H+ symporter-like MFS transporter
MEKTALEQDDLADAEDATRHDHRMTLLQAVKLYPKAVGWSVVMSTALVMDGFDNKLMVSLFAQPAFAKKYGKLRPKGKHQISAPWQSGLTNGSNVGQLIGLGLSGWMSEKLGFRKTMMLGLLIIPCPVFIQFFAPSLGVLETAQVLLGIPLGLFQAATCVYAVEVMPTCLRPYLTSYVDMCWVFGQLIASGVLRGCLNLSAPWAYRVPFAIQWFWPIPLMVGVALAPESPWWLVRKNRLEEAKVSVRRLTTYQVLNFDIDKNVALMALTTELEREADAGTSYIACFRGTNLRRTIIVMGCYVIQVLSGSTFRAYSTYFFQQAGLPTDQAFDLSVVAYALELIGVIVAVSDR